MFTESHHPIVPEGYPFIAGAALLVLLGWIVYPPAVVPLLILCGFVIFFFRNPEPQIPDGPGMILAPACGRIISQGEVSEERFLKGKCLRVSIFMSPFDAHVNRTPIAGRVTRVEYTKGSYSAAFTDRAPLANERNAVVFLNEGGEEILLVQIAGWFARRIVCHLQIGQICRRGDLFGLIRFGSRVDIFFPCTYRCQVREGDKVRVGETILALKGEVTES